MGMLVTLAQYTVVSFHATTLEKEENISPVDTSIHRFPSWHASSHNELSSDPRASIGGITVSPPEDQHIQVFLCSDEEDLRPLIATINSTVVNCRDGLQNEKNREKLATALAQWLPLVVVEIDSTSLDVKDINQRIAYFSAAGARKELANPYNFASFYLAAKYRHLPRIIYLDTDVIVQGDVTELMKMDLKGHPIAAVGDCSQRYALYFDFAKLERFGRYDPSECVFNHGMFVLDTDQWLNANVTQKIETWMKRFKDSGGSLYKYGVSQPPWLLALYKQYERDWASNGTHEVSAETSLLETKKSTWPALDSMHPIFKGLG
eukprot:CAMPEP_0114277712 /NCGR_PEP_ID=MMETSP0059-20121206/946_1 /TAXON_ID=36894 /ORGANISM="Pyramimonas parkeae, Strain CCMP726" /LENGTH=319 /DNA_ID=CAMNT_0001397855 /DNA_START=382 /DNA_END=1341 /DNA_ORIENTATION=-